MDAPQHPQPHHHHRGLELGKLSILGWEPFAGSTMQIYPGFLALVGNLVVAAVFTLVLRLMGVSNGTDETEPHPHPTLNADQTPMATGSDPALR